MDSARRIDSPGARARRSSQGLRLGLISAVLAAVACSGIVENDDGIASLELRYPATTFLEAGSSVQLSAVAIDRNGNVVESAQLRWRSPDTTVTVNETTGLVQSNSGATGTARIQVGVFGSDTIVTSLTGLTITLTGRADTVHLVGDDSLTVTRDTETTSFQILAAAGTELTGVPQRPITARIIEPVPVDSPTVVFQSGRVNDSLMTANNGIATFTVRNLPNRPVPDRAVVQIRARRANGQEIPGSGRTLVIRFLHQ